MAFADDPSDWQATAAGPTRITGTVELTADMAETLKTYFAVYAVDGVVTLETTEQGVWLKNPYGGRQFLGAARLPEAPN